MDLSISPKTTATVDQPSQALVSGVNLILHRTVYSSLSPLSFLSVSTIALQAMGAVKESEL